MHMTHKIVGWPIPVHMWTAVHYALFTAIEETLASKQRGEGHATTRSDPQVFERSLANMNKKARKPKV